MTRQEIYSECLTKLKKSNFLVNHLIETKYQGKHTSMLLLVAKIVHKQTWKDEFKKWGGINVDDLTIECYESLKKHEYESFDFIVMDECHHLNSDKRLDLFSTLTYDNVIGLSATIPKKLKQYFQYEYHAEVVTCSIVDAIEDEVLPEPQIILYPLQLDNVHPTESIELNPKAKGKIHYGNYNELWKYKKMKVHAIISCTPRQKVNEYNSLILYEKNRYRRTRHEFLKNKWLFDCGERIKYLANLKNNIVLSILQRLEKERTITFCKTIEQAECLGQYCIHSKNKDSSIGPQRIGRSLRHKSPIIIMPYYENTREEEIVQEMIKDFNKKFISTIHSIQELSTFLSDHK